VTSAVLGPPVVAGRGRRLGGMKDSQVRQAFVDFFGGRSHSHQPSASLISHDPLCCSRDAGDFLTGHAYGEYPEV